MHSVDWMTLVFERFQSAVRDMRLTLPPSNDQAFWSRFLELARLKRHGMIITLLLDSDPRRAEQVKTALKALPELERIGHEVSWVASSSLPFSLFIIDDLWSLIVAGDPEDSSGVSYVRLTEAPEETTALREAFDRIAGEGHWGLDPATWLEWLEKVSHRKPTRTALSAISRGEKRLEKTVRRALKAMPTRRCWMVKPRDSAYGLPEPPGSNHWIEWVKQGHVALGWQAVSEHIKPPGMLSRSAFERHFKRAYPDQKNLNRAYSTIRHFLEGMIVGDRVAAVEGWMAEQNVPVRFHGWARIEGDPEYDEFATGWQIVRPVQWYRYELDLPVNAVRTATGLESATWPIHRLNTGSFRRLVALAEEVRRNLGNSQLLLELAMVNNTPGPKKERME